MAYELLRGLYLGRESNADLSTQSSRQILHVHTPLDDLLVRAVECGLDVVLTGNPGDGKSHLVRRAVDRQELAGAEIQLDLSATPVGTVVAQWERAAASSRPLVLCANEGPLVDLLAEVPAGSVVRERADELGRQLGNLLVSAEHRLPPEPVHAMLIDLADRELVERRVLDRALETVCDLRLAPGLGSPVDRNMTWLYAAPELRERVSLILTGVARRLDDHVTFREVWAALSYLVCGGRTLEELEHLDGREQLLPLDLLCEPGAQGRLLEAAREHGDPATVASPDLDEALWRKERMPSGDWLVDDIPVPRHRPDVLWEQGRRREALDVFRSRKRLVALAHSEGSFLIDQLSADSHESSDDELLETLVRGTRACFLHEGARGVPDWLRSGLPLWVAHSYGRGSASEWPHLVTRVVPVEELCVRRPLRPAWLADALGPVPDIAWLQHRRSGVALLVRPPLLRHLRQAWQTRGPLAVPRTVSRFLQRLAGHLDARGLSSLGPTPVAFLERPRGRLISHASVAELDDGRAAYVR